VRAHHQLRVDIIGIEFENMFVIVTCADGVAQRREPGALDESGVNGELRARDAAAVERVNILRVRLELLLFNGRVL
jgi:hypothetical protein